MQHTLSMVNPRPLGTIPARADGALALCLVISGRDSRHPGLS